MRIANNEDKILNIEDAKRSAKFLHKMFTELGIKYWMDYGTLLGIVRNKAFIPYDTDIECYMLFKHEMEKHLVMSYLTCHGFRFSVDLDDRQGITIHDREGYIHMSFGWFKHHPILKNILPKNLLIKLGKKYTTSSSELIRPHEGETREKRGFNCWVRSFLPLIFCSRIQTVPFYDFVVCIPDKAEELLEIRYGSDWKIPQKQYKGYTV